MNIFNKKHTINNERNVLVDNYTPAILPTEPKGQKLGTYVPSDYPFNDQQVVENTRIEVENYVDEILKTCDEHSRGDECDHYVAAKMRSIYADHYAKTANIQNQITRIEAARQTRLDYLQRHINLLEEKIEKIKEDIHPLQDLRPKFAVKIANWNFSIGDIVTCAMLALDLYVLKGFCEPLLSNKQTALIITSVLLALMSDGSMWGLAGYQNRKCEIKDKSLYNVVCAAFLAFFAFSIIGTILIRWGSMAQTFGTITTVNDKAVIVPFAGPFNMAHYGITFLTSMCTTFTGLLSYAFSKDDNVYLIGIRSEKEKELSACREELDHLLNEQSEIEQAPDANDWNQIKKAAAIEKIKAFELWMKLYCRKKLTIASDDGDFTERMADSGKNLLVESRKTGIESPLPLGPGISYAS